MNSPHNAVIFHELDMISQFICEHLGFTTQLVSPMESSFLDDLNCDQSSSPADSSSPSQSPNDDCDKENFSADPINNCPPDDFNVQPDLNVDKLLFRQGSVRGVKNIVKNNKFDLIQQPVLRKYERLEEDTVVVYVTCLGIVRRTSENCRKLVAILENNGITFERRDLLFNKHYLDEFKERMDGKFIELPQMFVEGRHFGGLDAVEKMNEQGVLKQQLLCYIQRNSKVLCPGCYGFRYVPCPECHGGKKSRLIFVPGKGSIHLKCTRCDTGGLAACEVCKNGYLDV